jgi:conjugal transfer pilin signal peptidase TrbI
MKIVKFNELIDAIKQNIRNVVLLFCGLGVLVALLASQICIVETTSNSIPYYWCLQVYNLKPKKDDLCAFNFRGRKFIKYLVGTAGDEIKYSVGNARIGKVVYVGYTRVGWAKASVASVESVSPGETYHFSPIPEGKIPEGYVFVAGTHEDSLDSRYKEFGLIPVSAIRGKAFGLWRYKEEE